MIEIDGSKGEGGGQMIRSALALSAVTGKPFQVSNIRAGRAKPGLLRQHLTCVNATRDICNALVQGNQLYSNFLSFEPGEITPGEFDFDIGSAGSTTLVAQTLIPALMVANDSSRFSVKGGTHNMAAPPLDYLQRVFLPQIEKMGPRIRARIKCHGFYPAGGGQIEIFVDPVSNLKSLELATRDGTVKPKVTALVSKLPRHIGERECDVIRRAAGWKESVCEIIEVTDSPGPGNVVMIELTYRNVTEIFTGFGKPGLKSEDLARRTFREAKKYMSCDAPVGERLADQLLMPMGLAAHQGQTSRIVTGELSQHSKTHINILKLFLDIEVNVGELERSKFEVSITPSTQVAAGGGA